VATTRSLPPSLPHLTLPYLTPAHTLPLLSNFSLSLVSSLSLYCLLSDSTIASHHIITAVLPLTHLLPPFHLLHTHYSPHTHTSLHSTYTYTTHPSLPPSPDLHPTFYTLSSLYCYHHHHHHLPLALPNRIASLFSLHLHRFLPKPPNP
jgi:hypothetical protein